MDTFQKSNAIIKLNQQQGNQIVSYESIDQMTGHAFQMNPYIIYFPYRYLVEDEGWGCAWRAIQTLLSSQNIIVSFQTLYEQFSQKNSLLHIIKSKKNQYPQQTYDILSTLKWSPGEIKCHWAQPFIASLVCQKKSIQYQLLLLNGKPVSYAPLEVFQKVINYGEFISIIKNVISRSSIMIDDGTYCLSIIGFRQSEQQGLQLLFADPHIKNNRIHKNVGLYSKIYNNKGSSIQINQSSIQKEESLYNVINYLQFQTKNWMICFVDRLFI